MQVFAQTSNGQDSSVGNVAAFGENQVTESRGSVDDLLDTRILQLSAICQVQYSQTLVCSLRREAQEGLICDFPAVG